MALIMLVAVMPTAKSSSASTMVPSAPVSSRPRHVHAQLPVEHLQESAVVTALPPRAATAMLKATNRATGARVITAAICKNATITPTTTLAMIDVMAQLHLQLQLQPNNDI